MDLATPRSRFVPVRSNFFATLVVPQRAGDSSTLWTGRCLIWRD